MKPLVFHTTVPSLKETSCLAIGLECLRGEVLKCRLHEGILFHCVNLLNGNCIHLMNKNLKVNVMEKIPTIAKEMIDRCVESLKVEMEDWLNFHFSQIVLMYPSHDRIKNHNTSAVRYLDELIWFPNGTIDYTKTARKLLCNNELTDSEKYRIACAYCFEDEIKRLRPSHLDTEEEVNGREYLDQFWHERMIKDITYEQLRAADPDGVIRDKILRSLEYKNWWAVEYFLSYSQSHELVNLAKNACCCDRNAIQMMYWLPKLSGEQIHQVLNVCGCALVRRLMRYPKYSEHTLQIWSYLKSMISESDFLNMIVGIHADDEECGKCSRSDNRKITLYKEILKSIPDQLKYFALNALLGDPAYGNIFKYYVRESLENSCLRRFPRDFRMIFAMLSNANFEQRNQFWRNNWKNLIRGAKPLYLNKLMRLCFDNDDEITRFKESNMTIYDNIRDYCFQLVRNGHFTELDNFLKFCSSNEQEFTNLRTQVIDDPLRWSDSAKSYKEGAGFRLHVSCLGYFNIQRQFIQDLFDDDELLMVKDFVILFSSSEQDLLRWKQILTGFLHIYLVESRKEFTKLIFTEQWSMFSEWLSADEEEILNFKESLPIGESFVISLSNRSSHLFDEVGASFLEHFFLWYFRHPETAKNYYLIKNVLDATTKRYCEELIGKIPDILTFERLLRKLHLHWMKHS